MHVRPETKEFYDSLEKILAKKGVLNKLNIKEIKGIVYKDLVDLIATEEEVDIGRMIGKGASSEVYFGNFRFCPCAVKKIKMDLMNAKQIVSVVFWAD